jgi:hypothetical protein
MTAQSRSVSGPRVTKTIVCLLQEFGVLWLFEVLQVAEVGYELGLIVILLCREVIEIDGICEALHKLGPC